MTATSFNITPHWFSTWATYFPAGTDLIYTLNFADNASAWANAVAQAKAAHAGLGDSLVAFELGNEIDHFINKGWRDASWGVHAYIEQFRNVTAQIADSDWYRALQTTTIESGGDNNNNSSISKRINNKNKSKPPTIQAAVFADPPLVPDQHDETDDFSIANLTAAGLLASSSSSFSPSTIPISTYATHLYPQSACDPARQARLSLNLLSNHFVLYHNLSQYIPQIRAADEAGAPLVMGETNSVSCSGKSGVSDTLGAALWIVDYVLGAAGLGVRRVFFHLGARSEYSAFTPKGGYGLKGEVLEAGLRSGWYAHYFLARVVAATGVGKGKGKCGSGERGEREMMGLRVAALPGANSSSLSGFAIYSGGEVGNASAAATGHGKEEEGNDGVVLRKLVFLDMGVWNGTEGLSNPSTLSATDGTVFSEGPRPVSTFEVATPWAPGAKIRIVRLTGPGTNAKSGFAVAGTVFDDRTGEPVVGGGDRNGGSGGGLKLGEEYSEIIQVGDGGVVEFDVRRAEAVLLEVSGGEGDCVGGNGGDGDDDSDGSQDGSTLPGISGSWRPELCWGNLAVAALIGLAGIL